MSTPENSWFQQRCIDWDYDKDLSQDEQLREIPVAIGELHAMLFQIERGWETIRTIREKLGINQNAILPSMRLVDMVGSPLILQPMDTAPKDRPILAWCDHNADPYVEDEQTGRLTIYGGHCEGFTHANDGYNIVEWGGESEEYGDYGECLYSIPDWWFVVGSDFEVVANPIGWCDLPAKPAIKNR